MPHRHRTALFLLCLPIALCGQTDSLLLGSNLPFLEQHNAWLTSENAAGLTRLEDVGHLSDALLSFNYDQGRFCDYHQSPNALSYRADVASYYRLSDRTVLYGSIAYDNFSGRQMAGSVFIDPTHQPFDIVEDSLCNIGTKHRDTYRLVGAFGSMLTRSLAIGARIDYRTANYAKYKDLRHKNSLMDLVLSAGVSATLGTVQLGANLYYRRNIESIRFSTYGTADKVYKSLIDYGAFMGQVETYGDNGYTNKSREMPLLSEYHGLDVQASWNITPRLTWFNELGYRHRSGYYGRRSPYTISYNEHSSDVYRYHGRLSLRPSATAVHHIDVRLEAENLVNHSNSYRERTDDNTATYYEYYTPVKMGNKVWSSARMTYTAGWGISQLTPTWSVTAAVDLTKIRQTAYVYPYYRRQHLNSYEWSASLQRNIRLGQGLLSATLGMRYQHGTGEPFTDGTFVKPSDKQTPPPTMDAYLYRHYEYLTAHRYAADATLRYGHALPAIRMKPYVELHYQFVRAVDIHWLEGTHRRQFSFVIGTTF